MKILVVLSCLLVNVTQMTSDSSNSVILIIDKWVNSDTDRGIILL